MTKSVIYLDKCQRDIGLESGFIRNYQITASSFDWPPGGVHSAPHMARLNGVGIPGEAFASWRPNGLTTVGEWIQVIILFSALSLSAHIFTIKYIYIIF